MRAIIVAVALLGAQAFAGSTLSKSDQKFLTQAAACDHADAKFGQLAIERGIDPQVKALGRKMVDDQASMDRQLAQLAKQKGVSLPGQMIDKDAKLYRKLSGLSGDQFDRQFLKAMTERQKQAINVFETEAGTGDDGDVRAWANRGSMTVRAHRDLAKDARQHL